MPKKPSRKSEKAARPSDVAARQRSVQALFGFQISSLANSLSLWASRTYARECGASVIEWRVLSYIFSHGECAAKDIIADTLIDKGNVSRAVQTLVRKRMLARRAVSGDRRVVLLRLTAKGRRQHDKIAALSARRQARLSGALTADERRILIRAIVKLRAEAARMLEETEEP